MKKSVSLALFFSIFASNFSILAQASGDVESQGEPKSSVTQSMQTKNLVAQSQTQKGLVEQSAAPKNSTSQSSVTQSTPVTQSIAKGATESTNAISKPSAMSKVMSKLNVALKVALIAGAVVGASILAYKGGTMLGDYYLTHKSSVGGHQELLKVAQAKDVKNVNAIKEVNQSVITSGMLKKILIYGGITCGVGVSLILLAGFFLRFAPLLLLGLALLNRR